MDLRKFILNQINKKIKKNKEVRWKIISLDFLMIYKDKEFLYNKVEKIDMIDYEKCKKSNK